MPLKRISNTPKPKDDQPLIRSTWHMIDQGDFPPVDMTDIALGNDPDYAVMSIDVLLYCLYVQILDDKLFPRHTIELAFFQYSDRTWILRDGSYHISLTNPETLPALGDIPELLIIPICWHEYPPMPSFTKEELHAIATKIYDQASNTNS